MRHVFPQDQWDRAENKENMVRRGGMTLLEYFAGQALPFTMGMPTAQEAAEQAVVYAKALLEALQTHRENNLEDQ